MKYWIAETQNAQSYRKAIPAQAATETEIKRIATNLQAFEGTVLTIGESVDNNGWIAKPLWRKINGRWIKVAD